MDERNAQAELPGLVPSAPPELIAFRQTDYDVPFWARNNSSDARWNEAGDPPTQYWSLHPDGAWAEFLRQEEVEDDAEAAKIRRAMWVCRVPLGTIVDLRDVDTCSMHAISPDALIDPDWSACQALANRLRDAGCAGVISPNAAIAGHTNLTIFGARRAIDWQRRSILRSTIPAAIAAVGSPRPGLVEKVRRPPGSPTETLF